MCSTTDQGWGLDAQKKMANNTTRGLPSGGQAQAQDGDGGILSIMIVKEDQGQLSSAIQKDTEKSPRLWKM